MSIASTKAEGQHVANRGERTKQPRKLEKGSGWFCVSMREMLIASQSLMTVVSFLGPDAVVTHH